MKVERICRINKVLSTVNEYSKVENIPYKHQILYMNNQICGLNTLDKRNKKNNIVNKPINKSIDEKKVFVNISTNANCFLYDENLKLYDISYVQPTLDVYC